MRNPFIIFILFQYETVHEKDTRFTVQIRLAANKVNVLHNIPLNVQNLYLS